jgi:hypothetical protein
MAAVYDDKGEISWLHDNSQKQSISTNFFGLLKRSPCRLCERCIVDIDCHTRCPIRHFRKVRYQSPVSVDMRGRFDTVTLILHILIVLVLREIRRYVATGQKKGTDANTRGGKRQRIAQTLSKTVQIVHRPMGLTASKLAKQQLGAILPPISALRARVAPAGYYHLAMQFGPLIFETGLEG